MKMCNALADVPQAIAADARTTRALKVTLAVFLGTAVTIAGCTRASREDPNARELEAFANADADAAADDEMPTRSGRLRTCGTPLPDPERTAAATSVLQTRRSGLHADAAALEARTRKTISVQFHVLHDGNKGKLDRDEIDDQIDILNEAFAGEQGGASTVFSFRLAEVTYSNNEKWFEDCADDDVVEKYTERLHEGGTDTLNIYSCDPEGLLGFANMPWDTYDGDTYDAVVISYNSLPSGDYDGEGDTAVHEVGHWLGLGHTFDGGCKGKGDDIDDTPAEKNPAWGCPERRDTCKGGGRDPVHNYMDYTDDDCMTDFTEDQADRMRESWYEYRQQ